MANTDISSLDCEPISSQGFAKLKSKTAKNSILGNGTELLGLILTLITLATFSVSIFKWYSTPGTPIHEWDENEYYYNAAVFYESPSLKNVWRASRPNFLWLPTLILKVFQIPMTPNRISFLTAFLAWALIVYSVFHVSRILNSHRLSLLFSIALFFSLPLTFKFSIYILADLLVAAMFAALMALALSLIKSKKYENYELLTFFCVTVFCLITKPVFLMPILAIIGLVAIYCFLELSLKLKDKIRVSILLVAILVVSMLVGHRYKGLISSLYFNNEILGYWAPEPGIFSNILWYPNVLLENLCVGHALGLLSLLILFFLTVKTNTNVKCFKPILFMIAPWALMVVYVSLMIVSKSLRVFLFLFVFPSIFFPLLLDNTLDQLGRWASICLVILILMNASIALWFTCFDKKDFILSRRVSLKERKLVSRENFTMPITFEDAKTFEIGEFIKVDCLNNKKGCSLSSLRVFLPHSGIINASTFGSYPLLVKNDSKPLSELNPGLPVDSGLFRYGGWYQAGGIPSSFLNANYIVYYSMISCCQSPTHMELYNRNILKMLLKGEKY
ncbi:MAG: hypothetical protein ACKOA8_12390, partial [Deltaproteobacteria bacterium]